MVELAGDDAVYVDPEDVDAIRDGIAHVMPAEARRFLGWDEVARRTREIYEAVA